MRPFFAFSPLRSTGDKMVTEDSLVPGRDFAAALCRSTPVLRSQTWVPFTKQHTKYGKH